MIQRIQTLYLVIIIILSTITLFSPVAGLHDENSGDVFILNYRGLLEMDAQLGEIFRANTWMLTAIMVLIPLLCLVTVFLFKKRIVQIRLLFFNLVIMAGFYGILFIYLWQFGNSLQARWFLEIVSAFPLINIILSFMAIRSIGKDEALIKSLNRIR